ncbi:acyl transferase/acyl hydrolase/lysophospholipase [Mycena epipterygia]|nr:acyl transferase/acyl hydrolase/lysophospholipase [Mycena epipterygia]
MRLLSLDGGGITGLSSLIILQNIMYRIKMEGDLDEMPLPCEYFDLIGGTSTGGLIALMLGRLRMSVEDAISAYDQLAQEVFSETKFIGQDGKFKASRLEAAVKRIVSEKSVSRNPEEPMKDSGAGGAICRSFVCAQSAQTMRGNIPVIFRTYDSPDEPAAECTIWEAARATSAAPTFFKRIEIGPHAQTYIDGGLGRNNPTGTLIEEADAVFPGQRVACVVSIGTGQVKTTAIPKPSLFQRILPLAAIHTMVEIATDCEATNQEMVKRFTGTPHVYFRFNVDQGMQSIKTGEWERLSEVSAHTHQYLRYEGVRQQMGEAVKVLRDQPRKGG